MVCELLDGETLREKMQEGPISQRRALEYASQIAEGLAAAHDKGVVHRDLKPENVFVTNRRAGEGARLRTGEAGAHERRAGSQPGDGATATVAVHTMPGMVLGTAGYMSPEQVRGKEVDARTDIFAFGAILYEMLSGRRAFKGESSVETMNAILKDDPPELERGQAQAYRPGSSASCAAAWRRSRRAGSTRRATWDLPWKRSPAPRAPATCSLKRAASRAPPLAESCSRWRSSSAAAVLGAYYLGRGHAAASDVSYRQLTFEPGYAGPARFTRDGNTVVYSAAWNGGAKQLYSQRSNSQQGTSLNLDADVLGIADNGDMAVILKRHFLASWLQRGTLARMPLEGGAPRPILEDVYEADITRDGKDFAVVRRERGKQRLEYPIGKVLFETAGWITDVRISPDQTQVAFIEHPILPDDRGIIALTDKQGNLRRLTPSYSTGRSMCWTPDGKEIWYTASLEGEDPGLYAVTLGGKDPHRAAFANRVGHRGHLVLGQGAAGERALPNRVGSEARHRRERARFCQLGRSGLHVPRRPVDRLQPFRRAMTTRATSGKSTVRRRSSWAMDTRPASRLTPAW